MTSADAFMHYTLIAVLFDKLWVNFFILRISLYFILNNKVNKLVFFFFFFVNKSAK